MTNFISARDAGSRAAWALILGSLAGLSAAGTASADSPPGNVPSVVVKYRPDSLASDNGVQNLYRQIKYAARQVCPDASIQDLHRQQLVMQCRDQAIERAVRQIGNPQLAALHANHSKNG